MLEAHVASGASVTVAGIRVAKESASEFGVIETDESGQRITHFHEKPANPPTIPGSPDQSYASMGNYIFNTDALIAALQKDAADENSIHDMGTNIIPMMTAAGEAAVYDFDLNEIPGATDRDRGYWRDVGTLDTYHEAHMDLVSVHPIFNLYNDHWPILTNMPSLAPAKFVQGGTAHESIVGAGSILAGAHVRNSVVANAVRVDEGAYVDGVVLMPGVRIGRCAVIRNAILDKNIIVPEGAQIGVDLDLDRQRYTVSEGGIVVLGKGQQVL